MTKRNFTKELLYTYYTDMKNGDDVESIDYRSLIHIITELHNRIEELENQVENLRWDKIRELEIEIENLKWNN